MEQAGKAHTGQNRQDRKSKKDSQNRENETSRGGVNIQQYVNARPRCLEVSLLFFADFLPRFYFIDFFTKPKSFTNIQTFEFAIHILS
jgi:hypothetical protein